jgi:CxxC motif-containing protein (DUF1111 family)
MNARTRALSVTITTLLFLFPLLIAGQETLRNPNPATEAPAAFDNKTNGYLSQLQFEEFKDTFEEVEGIDEGLGPTFNEASCAACHGIPVTGGSGLQLETRAGRLIFGHFVEHPGGSLVQDQLISTCPRFLTEFVFPGEDSTPRASLNVLGDGFVEAIADDSILQIASQQPPDMQGKVIKVPVSEANGAMRVGRFGWKNQHASLESFAADAYLNEMGITSPLQPTENTANGLPLGICDQARDPEDDGSDVRVFADFMRATKVPPRGPISDADNQAGSAVFAKIGCATCHVSTFTTAAPGTPINGGAFTVPPALGNKIIHPYSDFLLHDIGTSDPIVQNGGPDTYDYVRTPPLWGLRTRTQLMHDGQSTTVANAIARHSGQASKAASGFRALSGSDKRKLIVFLSSL